MRRQHGGESKTTGSGGPMRQGAAESSRSTWDTITVTGEWRLDRQGMPRYQRDHCGIPNTYRYADTYVDQDGQTCKTVDLYAGTFQRVHALGIEGFLIPVWSYERFYRQYYQALVRYALKHYPDWGPADLATECIASHCRHAQVHQLDYDKCRQILGEPYCEYPVNTTYRDGNELTLGLLRRHYDKLRSLWWLEYRRQKDRAGESPARKRPAPPAAPTNAQTWNPSPQVQAELKDAIREAVERNTREQLRGQGLEEQGVRWQTAQRALYHLLSLYNDRALDGAAKRKKEVIRHVRVDEKTFKLVWCCEHRAITSAIELIESFAVHTGLTHDTARKLAKALLGLLGSEWINGAGKTGGAL